MLPAKQWECLEEKFELMAGFGLTWIATGKELQGRDPPAQGWKCHLRKGKADVEEGSLGRLWFSCTDLVLSMLNKLSALAVRLYQGLPVGKAQQGELSISCTFHVPHFLSSATQEVYLHVFQSPNASQDIQSKQTFFSFSLVKVKVN